MNKPTEIYVATYERDDLDDAWNVRVVGQDGCQTYGRSLRQAQTRIREALAAWLEASPESLTIRDEFPPRLAEVAAAVHRLRSQAEEADARAQAETATAARALTDLGLSRRDTAELLGLSHQRIQQLLEAS